MLFYKFRKKMYKYIAKNIPWYKLRIFLYKRCGYVIGEPVYIAEGLTIAEKLSDSKNVIIGDRVAIGPNVILVTSSDPNFSKMWSHVKIERGRVVIEDDAWIGAGAIILPNVTIGKCSIVGAGAVVTKDVDNCTIVAGVPAKKIGNVAVE